ncbi:MAG: sugar ABC transporter permease [Anaerolineales bacterium]|nr:sugar ABC transporter permease [Anaerolineales bacterium]
MAIAQVGRKRAGLRVFESKMQRNEAMWAYIFLLPNLLLFLAFTIYPIFASFYYSLTRWTNLAEPGTFIGFENYVQLAQDPIFRTVLLNTFYYTFGVIPLQTVLGLAIAVLLNQQVRFRTVYRAAYFVPVVTSMVAVSMVWQWMYQREYGVINSFLKLAFGIQGPNWLFSEIWSMPAVIIMSIWKNVGYSIVLYLAALQGVPDSLYESAMIDGANSWKRFRHITVPLISPTTFYIIVLSIIGSFQSFDQIYVLTGGGPVRATSVIVHYLYQNGFQWFNMGYAASIAWVLFAMLFIVTILQWTQRRRWVFGEE